MRLPTLIGAAVLTATLASCASYGPPPPGFAGEGWGRHVRRCLRNYPNYHPSTDLVERRNGVAFRCPL